MERQTLTVEEAATGLGVSKAFAYQLVERGELPSLRLGRRRLVLKDGFQKLLRGKDSK